MIFIDDNTIVTFKGIVGRAVCDYNNGVNRFLPGGSEDCYIKENLPIINYFEEDIRESTHEEKMDLIRQEYKWGEIVTIHYIGEYQIVEALSELGTIHWHLYFKYKNTYLIFHSLDQALIGGIGYKYENRYDRAALYFARMIGLEYCNDYKQILPYMDK